MPADDLGRHADARQVELLVPRQQLSLVGLKGAQLLVRERQSERPRAFP
jgi:hypothetical protein